MFISAYCSISNFIIDFTRTSNIRNIEPHICYTSCFVDLICANRITARQWLKMIWLKMNFWSIYEESTDPSTICLIWNWAVSEHVLSGGSDFHYSDVTMGAIASQITGLTIVYSTVYSDAHQRKHPRHWPLCGEFTGDVEFPAQMASNPEYVSIWWRHHVCCNQRTIW